MKRSALLPLVLLAACGPKPPAAAPTAPVNQGGATGLAPTPVYAALFDETRSWTYTLTTTDDHWDDQDPKADAQGNVHEESRVTTTCTVAATRHFDGGLLSQIACDENMASATNAGADPLQGVWVANRTGLYYLGQADVPDDGVAPSLDGAALVLEAVPTAKKTSTPMDDDGEDPATETDIMEKDGAWCWTESVTAGDDSYQSLCFDAHGVSSGGWGWAGGSTHETTFTIAP